MKQLQAWGMIVALGFAGAAAAQTETAPQQDQQAQGEQQGQQDQQGSPATAEHPTHSTLPTEGTAADTTPPGETATRDTRQPTAEVEPATDIEQGTAADKTAPGEMAPTGVEDVEGAAGETRTAAAGDAMGSRRASKLIGMKVQTPTGESIGQVEDLVLDDTGRVSQLVVNRSTAAGGARLAALPWSQAKGMIRANALVIERSRLDSAQSYDAAATSR